MPKNINLPKAYNPQEVEDKIYKKWEDSGYFNPDNLPSDHKEPFTISMPPPNVTGVLHLGHALENTIMDTMIRYQRMRGKKALLLPGTDHAAVATQARVEKNLIEAGKYKNPRQELGRDKLLVIIRDYAEQSKATIISQIRKMGTSCDWSRLAYTFDEQRTKAVNEVFIKMYNDGLIYRGYRVVNWSVQGQSTCSDDELVYVERLAKLYTFKYTKDFPISIATTRPETKLGDTAVAVHPEDKRYKQYIGQTFTVDIGAAGPLKIQIIGDPNVDPSFGTGAVGVTPAHSMADYEMYERHSLALIQVIGKDGKMTENAGRDYQGLTAEEARAKFIKYLKKEGLLEKEEDITQNVGTSDRFGDIVEVLPMTQWFVNVNKKIPGTEKSLKDLMREAVTIGHKGDGKQKIKITPQRFEKIYLNWIDNLRDWCISRQIWWGHRIPVWYDLTIDEYEEYKNDSESFGNFLNYTQPKRLAVGFKQSNIDGNWLQDPNTLDTWFSSGLWTFSTLGWPEQTNDLKTFHPTTWMQMGHELVFFWMARMILMSTYALDEIPFKDVYIHGILRDKDGRKFSKSLGNGIDPLEIIGKYGTDALRLSLIAGTTPGNDARFYEEKVEGARNFINKLWNIARYILTNVNNINIDTKNIKPKTLADKWIIEQLDNLIYTVNNALENYQFSSAIEIDGGLKNFIWDKFADWYLEISKFEKNKEKDAILVYVLKNLLKLCHPFIPFITERIWLEIDEKRMLLIEQWPKAKKYMELTQVNVDFMDIQYIITTIRNARSKNKIEPAKKIKVVIYAGDKIELVKSQEHLIKNLKTGIEELEIKKSGKKINQAIYITIGEIDIYLVGAVDPEKEKQRITAEIEQIQKYIKQLENKLNNKDFINNAPEAIVHKEKDKLAEQKEKLEKLRTNLKSLKFAKI
jgi:valyl-tRNA synthetase